MKIKGGPGVFVHLLCGVSRDSENPESLCAIDGTSNLSRKGIESKEMP